MGPDGPGTLAAKVERLRPYHEGPQTTKTHTRPKPSENTADLHVHVARRIDRQCVLGASIEVMNEVNAVADGRGFDIFSRELMDEQ